MKIPRLSRTSDFLLSKLSSFHGASRVSYISRLVQFPFIRRVRLYLLPSYLRRRNISPLFSQSFILVPLLFLVHQRPALPPALFRAHSSFQFFYFFFLSPTHSSSCHTCSITGLVCVRTSVCFPQFHRVTGQPPCFSVRPPARSLVLNFLRRGFATVGDRHLHFGHSLFITCPNPSYLLSSSSSSLQPRDAVTPSVSTVLLSVTLVVLVLPGIRFYSTRRSAPSTTHPRSPFLFAILSILFAAHLNAWRTTWDKKGIHGRATRRTPETQIYFFNTVNITVPGDA